VQVTKGYGTVIACICFFSWITPVLETPEGLEEAIARHDATSAEGAKEEGGDTRRQWFF
jgi:hypothetical protein